jgi:hypothetical protein
VRAAVGIVLEALDFARNPVLVALEVDNTIALLVTAALVANRNTTVIIAAAFRRLLQ